MLDQYPPELQAFVQQKIDAGVFKTADDFAVRAAELYRDLDRRYSELRESLVEAVADIESGNCLHLNGEDELREFGEDIKRRGRELLRDSSLDP